MKKTILAAGVLTALGAGPGLAQEFEFTLHHFLGPEAPAHREMLEPWARQVEENSGGRVAIEIYPSMTLGGRPPELVQQVRDGVVDMVWTLNGYTPGLFPAHRGLRASDRLQERHLAPRTSPWRRCSTTISPTTTSGLEVMFLHVHAGQAHPHDRDRGPRARGPAGHGDADSRPAPAPG